MRYTQFCLLTLFLFLMSGMQSLEAQVDFSGENNGGNSNGFSIPAITEDTDSYNLIKEEKSVDFSARPRRQISMQGSNNYKSPIRKVELNIDKEETENQGKYNDRMYFGDFKSNGKEVTIACRDHEYQDGDRIKILINDFPELLDVYLTNAFKTFTVKLASGFNKIDFQALNQGTSGPNTAHFIVYDEEGEQITSNEWNLATGAKATLIIVKE